MYDKKTNSQKVNCLLPNSIFKILIFVFYDSTMNITNRIVMLSTAILVLLSFSIGAYGQISGRVLDTDGKPITGASVYVNNTTYGCLSVADGSFRLIHFPKPPFQLTVSCVGFESSSVAIKDSAVAGIHVSLKQKNSELTEIVINSPDKDGWEKYGKEFIRDFIGYSAFADETEILNKKDIEFTYDAGKMSLSVTAAKPLRIRNKATGYLITYWLEHYEKSYVTHKIFHKGDLQFEPILSKKEGVKTTWTGNRRSAYYGSLNHFLRSVYQNCVYQDSFELRVYKRIESAEYGKTVPFQIHIVTSADDTAVHNALLKFLHYDTADLIKFAEPIKKWLHAPEDQPYKFQLEDKVINTTHQASARISFGYNPEKPSEKRMEYFDYDYLPTDTVIAKAMSKLSIKDANGKNLVLPERKPTTIAYLWTQKIPLDSFVTRFGNGKVMLQFKDYIHVTYTPEVVEPAYVQEKIRREDFLGEPQTSLIRLENERGITILPNGNYFEPYDLMIEEYWSYEKIDKMLPLDYIP